MFCFKLCYSQTNNIRISAILIPETNEIKIEQEIVFYNNSASVLKNIYLHNWPNAYKDKNTPLAKRFVENYSKAFHFEKEKYRGKTTIKSLLLNDTPVEWKIPERNPDIIEIHLKNDLYPKDSVIINADYYVKIPKDKYTKYGVNNFNYNLRYWYLAPAIYTNKWNLMNNLDMDDLYIDFSNYTINISVPTAYTVNSDLDIKHRKTPNLNFYTLSGKNRLDVELNISKENTFINFNSNPVKISTNLNSEKLGTEVKTQILNRALEFIETYLGPFPNDSLMINKIDYEKNPVYGFNQLPSFLAPFADNFEWDIKIFKVLSKKYINNTLLFQQREDAWLSDGLQTYLMIKYVEKFYPEIKAVGNISKLWGIRNFNLAQIDFNDKYTFVYQFATRKNIDQSLNTETDSLSNFNRKIVNKYKAGLGINYLEKYLGKDTLEFAIKNYAKAFSGKMAKSDDFFNYLKTHKNISWFKNDYLKTSKKIDYTIKKIDIKKDSIEVIISNKRNFSAPIQLYGLKDNQIRFQQWLISIDSIQKVTIPKNGFDRLALNYELQLPEYNLRNNWKNVEKRIFNRPLQIKFMKDLENPYYNQLFYAPVYRYNYYDGLVLGFALSNKTILRKNFTYKLTPSYSTKSNTFSGSYSFLYEYLPEESTIKKFSTGIYGSEFHYAPNLSYTTFTPYAVMEFKKDNLRDAGGSALSTSFTVVDREKSPEQLMPLESNKYNVFSIGYNYSKPNIIEDIRFSTGLEIAEKFAKVSLTGQYRLLTDTNRQFDFRFFAGAFLKNNTNTDFFSFALDRPTDYLFQYEYLGRSETSGIMSQQVIINEGGFKSKLPVPYANQWLSTINTSVGIWRWAEVYNDVGFIKNKNEDLYFAYENGIRLNFIQDILEVYFPVYSNLGWEVSQQNYSSKIRFVLVINPKRIYNFVRRGFY